ncbi:MAG: septal ring lytic transglycosylase RlpA family protein [Burkholderiaceae bacterium]
MTRFRTTWSLLVFSLSMGVLLPAHAEGAKKDTHQAKEKSSSAQKKKAHRAQHGKASYYGKEFFGRKMADGTKMDPHSNIAASKTLPLGTVAEVTNLENGKSEVVEIRDRGPYVEGRIVDVTPKTAKELGFKEDGVAPVVVKPIDIPESDSSAK